MKPTRRCRSAVATMIVAMLAVGCSSKEEPPSAAPTSAATSTTPTAPTTSPTGSARPSTVASSSSATAAGGSSTPSPTDGAREPAAPPAPGVYTYEQDGESSIAFFGYDDEGTLRVERPDGDRQRQTRTLSENQRLTQTYRFTPDAVLLEQARQQVYGQEFTCRFDPPLRILRLPLEVGASWKGEGSCEGVTVTFSARVTDSDPLSVDGRRVRTFQIRSTYRAEGDGFSQETDATTWLSPAHRVVIRSRQTSEGSQGGFSYTSTLTERLVSLRPDPL